MEADVSSHERSREDEVMVYHVTLLYLSKHKQLLIELICYTSIENIALKLLRNGCQHLPNLILLSVVCYNGKDETFLCSPKRFCFHRRLFDCL